MNATQSDEERVQKRRHFAARNRTVLVQCGQFRCVAYRDADGKWRSYFGNEELKGEVTEVKLP